MLWISLPGPPQPPHAGNSHSLNLVLFQRLVTCSQHPSSQSPRATCHQALHGNLNGQTRQTPTTCPPVSCGHEDEPHDSSPHLWGLIPLILLTSLPLPGLLQILESPNSFLECSTHPLSHRHTILLTGWTPQSLLRFQFPCHFLKEAPGDPQPTRGPCPLMSCRTSPSGSLPQFLTPRLCRCCYVYGISPQLIQKAGWVHGLGLTGSKGAINSN